MSRRECEIKKLQSGDRFYYSPDKNKGGYIVRNTGDTGVVIVEQDSGQITSEDENLIVYTNDSLGE